MSKGFTILGVAARIQTLDFEASAWRVYTALCTLARVRGMDKKALVGKVFGATGKESQSFRQAWNIGAKLFANGMAESHKTEVAEMTLDDAIAYVLARLDAHMMALNVNGKNAYVAIADYSSAEALATARGLADADAKAEAEAKAIVDAAKAEAASEPEATPAPAPVPTLDTIQTAIRSLPLAELDALAAWFEAYKAEAIAAATPVPTRKPRKVRSLADLAVAA